MDRPAFAQTAAEGIEATIIGDVSLIGVERRGVANLPDLTGQVLLTLAAINTSVLLISGTSAAGDFCFVIPQHCFAATLGALRSGVQEAGIRRVWATEDVLVIRAKTPPPPIGGSLADLCGLLAAAGVNILLMQGHSASQVSLVTSAADRAEVHAVLKQVCPAANAL